jgi:polyhydroxybutyrate depolymerase
MHRPFAAVALIVLLGSGATAKAQGKQIKVKAGGLTREARVYAPAKASKTPSPVLFAFHGHSSHGTMEAAAKLFNYQKHWPQAIVVYMQGLPIASSTDPEGKKPGWQHAIGEVEDRDLKFFDRTLARLKQDYQVDDRRIYATGHSNGGGFTYLLWAARGNTFAAVAPCSASSATWHADRYLKDLQPMPALHVAGKKDTSTPYEAQKKLMEAIRKVNECESNGKPWHKVGTIYPSARGTPFVELSYNGGHEHWDEASPLIVQFFKEHARKK